MPYSLRIGMRYLRSKKRSTISVITFIAVAGVALGVAALLSVLSITSGFQQEFRNKVLGVNAHVLVLKYGLDFDEYRDVIAKARRMPEVAGAAPFLINEMMLAKNDRLSGVLVKGVDPKLMPTVLDLPHQMIQGSLDGLRIPGTAPPLRPQDVEKSNADDDDWSWLSNLTRDGGTAGAAGTTAKPAGGGGPPTHPGKPQALPGVSDHALIEHILDSDGGGIFLPDGGLTVPGADQALARAVADGGTVAAAGAGPSAPLPQVQVPSPEDVEHALDQPGNQQGALPTDAQEKQFFAEEAEREQQHEDGTDSLPGIVVGTTLAKNLGLGVGDRVKLISPLAGLDVSMWRPSDRAPRSRDFRVIGIFQAGFQEYDSRLVYTDLYEAQRFYDNGDTVTGVEMRLHDIDKAPEVARKLDRTLGGGPFHTMDWEELNHNLFTALAIQKVMLSLVIATIIFVAAFNVVATLIMIVLEKKREIAILKAMGATDGGVLSIFLVQGVVIGVFGTLIGLVLGGLVVGYLSTYRFPLDPKVYLIDHLPVLVNPMEFVTTALIAIGICTFATMLPSWWAARLLPADGVRYE